MKFQVLPKHIAFIMDGNRRWAKHNKLTSFQGHQKGLDRSREIIEECRRLGISCVTLWGFSTENWRRGKAEIGYLMRLFEKHLRSHIHELHQNHVVVRHLGRKDRLPVRLIRMLTDAEKLTQNNSGMILQLALDYGGRDEILRALSKISRKKCCSEEDFRVLLDTAGSPDPDLIVRTSGEMRTSGFLIWQGAYSELYFTKKCFPDFTVHELYRAFKEYEKRKRTYGE